jgi:serine/threonine-protein kinase
LGPVFRAYDADRERLVAVKLFKLDLPPERVHQLVAEFEQLIAAELNHPAIAKPVAAGISAVSAYLAQDYVAAESLDLAVREYGPAPAPDALRVAAQLAGALDFAAVVNLHHGALHPRDVLLSPDDTRLTGIGVAQALQKVGVSVPVRRPYTAPERLADPAITLRADVFGLAAVTFELFSGKRIAGPGDPADEAIAAVAGADAAALRAVFARALADKPDERFETALEFVDALKHAFPGITLSAEKPSKKMSKRPAKRAEPLPALPLDEPELTDRADIEVPIVRTSPEPSLDVEPVLREPEPAVTDLPLAAAEAQRYEAAEVGPQAATLETAEEPAPPAAAEAEHEVFASAIERSRSAVWPLMLALFVGIAVGFAAGYGVGGRDRGPAGDQSPVASRQSPVVPAPQPAGKEFTENAVPPPVTPDDRSVRQADQHPTPAAAPSVRPKPDTTNEGRLLVRSTPAGAHVTVDGKDAGPTPATVRDLTIGAHQIRVSREGYVTEERHVTLTHRQTAQSLTISLEREHTAASRGTQTTTPAPATPGTLGRFAGAVLIESRPTGAKVFLDGKLIGTTPMAMSSVSAGEHAVRLEYDGYRRWTSSVRVVAGEQNRVTASLER